MGGTIISIIEQVLQLQITSDADALIPKCIP